MTDEDLMKTALEILEVDKISLCICSIHINIE